MATLELSNVWFVGYVALAFVIVGVMVWRISRKKGLPFS
jgi:hypothetical protein